MRFGVLITGDPSPFTRERFGTYADLFIDLLAEQGESWDLFDTRLGEYPPDFIGYEGFVITGSASTAHEPEPWILNLNRAIRAIYAAGPKILGVCFGHQAVANALGGASQINSAGWEVGIHTLHANDDSSGTPSDQMVRANLKIIQIHRDHVVTPPPGARVLASTPATPVQMFAIDDSVLCMQGHPEFHKEIVADLIQTRRDAGILAQDVAERGLASLEQDADRLAWRQLIRNFLLAKR